MAAGDRTGKRRPRGRPFKPGEMPPVGRPWPKGVSPNPGGKPASAPGFRAACRAAAEEMIPALKGSPTPAQVEAFKAIADRGGYISPAAALELLPQEQRLELLRALQEEQREKLPPAEAPAPGDVGRVE